MVDCKMPESQVKQSKENEETLEKPHKKVKSFQNKVVIRKLPPNLNAEAFSEMVSPLPDYHELYFCPADWTLGSEATSRAYIEFKHEEDVSFKDLLKRQDFNSHFFYLCRSLYLKISLMATCLLMPLADPNILPSLNTQHFKESLSPELERRTRT